MKKTTSESTVTADKYWFKPKKYGWGWGLPQTKQGWMVFVGVAAIWLFDLLWFTSIQTDSEPSKAESVIFGAVLVADLAGLLYFSFKYGEPPKWRWGNKK